jgi:hypothetical protein
MVRLAAGKTGVKAPHGGGQFPTCEHSKAYAARFAGLELSGWQPPGRNDSRMTGIAKKPTAAYSRSSIYRLSMTNA